MENQNNIDKYFRKLSEEQEPKKFKNMDSIWDKVEEKLDEKKKKRIIPLWEYFEVKIKMKYVAIAASLLLLITLGSRFINQNPITENSESETNEMVVIDEEKIKEEFDSLQNSEDVVAFEETKKNEVQEKVVYVSPMSNEQESVSDELADSEVIVSKSQAQENLNQEKINVLALKDSVSKSNEKMTGNSLVNENTVESKTKKEISTEKTITGIVTSTDDGLPILGATVIVKGKPNEVKTDLDGKYSIQANVGDILVFSYLGMKLQEIKVGVSNVINALLASENNTGLVSVVGNKTTSIETTITGVVTSAEDGLPLPGASVVVKGTTRGVQTDLDGKYSIIAKQGETFVFSYLGTTTKEIKVGASKVINVQLFFDNSMQMVEIESYRASTSPKRGSASINKAQKNSIASNIVSETETSFRYNYDKSIRKEEKRKTIKEEKSVSIGYLDSESYEEFVENQFESAKSNPVSTFSIDVNNASYTNIRRFINNGQTVPKDAVRIEEMINFFKYDYQKPTGEHPFSINTEYSDAPWNPNHKLLRIALKGKEIPTDNLPKSNFVFLVDLSGSMEEFNKLPLLQSSMKVLLDELRDGDYVSIVYYASGTGVLLEPSKASDKKKIIVAIDNMSAGGGTSGAAGIDLAYQMAEKHFIKGGNNRIILATDGDFNIGASSDAAMEKLIEEKRKSGVFLTCLGFGMGNYKDSKMTVLSKKGNGNYAYIDNIQEANRFLGKEFKGSMFAIAKDVKIQIEFNPTYVQAYRLIGYEMRKLRNEDFTNDAIDAGELGSGHTVTALYEVIPTGVKSEFYSNQNELKYTQVNPVAQGYENELATVKFRYKKPDGNKSIEMVHVISNQKITINNASKDFKFATAVAWFGLKLRDSELVSNKESKDIIKLAKEGLQNDTDGYKAEFIRLVESVK